MVLLGVNVDHVATIRQARQGTEPDPILAAGIAELAGADVITIHLREDRRHVQDRDARVLKETIQVPYNFEISCAPKIVDLACEIIPEQATLVPEKREEVTTEGGLDLIGDPARVQSAIDRLKSTGIKICLFLDPDPAQIEAAAKMGADAVELHTGQYALSRGQAQSAELQRLISAGEQTCSLGMQLHAGHGLTYTNVLPIARIPRMEELHIGHSIIARAVFVGLDRAVRDMKQLLNSLNR